MEHVLYNMKHETQNIDSVRDFTRAYSADREDLGEAVSNGMNHEPRTVPARRLVRQGFSVGGIFGVGRNQQNGFTLIEILVAFTMLTFLLTGALVAMNNNLRIAVQLRQQLVAINLAQEGLEIARNLRDNDWFAGAPFGTSLPEGTYSVEWNSGVVGMTSDARLTRNEVTGIYGYGSGAGFEETVFKRSIEIADESSGGILNKKVIVTVSWPVSGGTKTITGELRLFDWR